LDILIEPSGEISLSVRLCISAAVLSRFLMYRISIFCLDWTKDRFSSLALSLSHHWIHSYVTCSPSPLQHTDHTHSVCPGNIDNAPCLHLPQVQPQAHYLISLSICNTSADWRQSYDIKHQSQSPLISLVISKLSRSYSLSLPSHEPMMMRRLLGKCTTPCTLPV
jgi:hypothetical protein